jgi:hypothetical protein
MNSRIFSDAGKKTTADRRSGTRSDDRAGTNPACNPVRLCFVRPETMKTTLLALVVAGFCSAAFAQSVYFNRSCGSGFGVSYAGNGFSFSYGTAYPQVVSYGWPWGAVYYGAPAAPVNYYCPPVYVNPCAYPVRAPAYSYRPVRAVVADPIFPARRSWR